MRQTLATTHTINEIHEAAREARRVCTDIIRQTSIKPYYGKIGAAALYAADDKSEAQRSAIAQAVEHLNAANALLVDIAVNGGTTEAKVREILSADDIRTRIQICPVEDDVKSPSISEKTTLQK